MGCVHADHVACLSGADYPHQKRAIERAQYGEQCSALIYNHRSMVATIGTRCLVLLQLFTLGLSVCLAGTD